MRWVVFLLISFLMAGCGEEEFTQATTSTNRSVDAIRVRVNELCSGVTPTPLDVLLVYDNSDSKNFSRVDLSQMFIKLLGSLSQYQDYRVIFSPLIPPPNEDPNDHPVISNRPIGVTSVNQVPLSALSVPPTLLNVGAEYGLKRVIDLYNLNRDRKVIRSEGYAVVIIVSNGDDSEVYSDSSGNQQNQIGYEDRYQQIKKLPETTKSRLFRFISVINKTKCGSTVKNPSGRYPATSERIFTSQNLSPEENDARDVYDLCTEPVTTIFGRLSKSLERFRIGHSYRSWPIGTDLDFDPKKLDIRKKSTQARIEVSSTNGYQFVPTKRTNYDIIDRTGGGSKWVNPELYSGYFIDLFGSAKLQYPDCLIVTKEDFTKFFRHAALDFEPNLTEGVVVKINGKEIPNSETNGWTYIGVQASIPARVNSRTDLTYVAGGPNISGYVFRFHGSAIYTDGASVEIFAKPKIE